MLARLEGMLEKGLEADGREDPLQLILEKNPPGMTNGAKWTLMNNFPSPAEVWMCGHASEILYQGRGQPMGADRRFERDPVECRALCPLRASPGIPPPGPIAETSRYFSFADETALPPGS